MVWGVLVLHVCAAFMGAAGCVPSYAWILLLSATNGVCFGTGGEQSCFLHACMHALQSNMANDESGVAECRIQL